MIKGSAARTVKMYRAAAFLACLASASAFAPAAFLPRTSTRGMPARQAVFQAPASLHASSCPFARDAAAVTDSPALHSAVERVGSDGAPDG